MVKNCNNITKKLKEQNWLTDDVYYFYSSVEEGTQNYLEEEEKFEILQDRDLASEEVHFLNNPHAFVPHVHSEKSI